MKRWYCRCLPCGGSGALWDYRVVPFRSATASRIVPVCNQYALPLRSLSRYPVISLVVLSSPTTWTGSTQIGGLENAYPYNHRSSLQGTLPHFYILFARLPVILTYLFCGVYHPCAPTCPPPSFYVPHRESITTYPTNSIAACNVGRYQEGTHTNGCVTPPSLVTPRHRTSTPICSVLTTICLCCPQPNETHQLWPALQTVFLLVGFPLALRNNEA